MRFDPRSLIDPVFFSRLDSIELRARSIVEGSMHGQHRSPYLGLSVEFASHREYAPGDDLRHLNWKLYARHDRLYVKEYDADTNMNLYLLLDASASMSCAHSGTSKLRYAASLAAALAHLALKQRDAVGLTVYSDTVTSHLPPRAKPGQLDEVLAMIAAAEFHPASDSARALHEAAEFARRRGMVVLFSDLFGDLETIVGGLDHLRYNNHEVIVWHIMDPVERDLGVDGLIRCRDLESGETLSTHAEGVREAYRRAVDVWRQALETECRKRAINRIELVTSEPPDRALLDYLVRRAKTF
jgi:uncharacterized protein (DUF58 family)